MTGINSTVITYRLLLQAGVINTYVWVCEKRGLDIYSFLVAMYSKASYTIHYGFRQSDLPCKRSGVFHNLLVQVMCIVS